MQCMVNGYTADAAPVVRGAWCVDPVAYMQDKWQEGGAPGQIQGLHLVERAGLAQVITGSG